MSEPLAARPVAPGRLVGLDVFRGATVAAMLLVNNPGTWGAIYPPLEHAEWHGWTPTDLIFPFFLFVVGVTTELSLGARAERGDSRRAIVNQIVRRGSIIVVLGLLLNAFPFYTWATVEGVQDPTLLQRIAYRFENLRFSGVLQRIGIVYMIAALIGWSTSVRTQRVLIIAILAGYWGLMTIVPVPGTGILGRDVLDRPSETLAAWVDRAVLGERHIWKAAKTWDPEGPVSTIPAIATALLGVEAGRRIREARRQGRGTANALVIPGTALLVAGLAWGLVFPINKNLWTSSYVVFTAGAAMLGIVVCGWFAERAPRWALHFFLVFGMNPIVAFVGSGVMARFTDSLIRWRHGEEWRTLHKAIYDLISGTGIDPMNASLAYAIGFVLVWYAILSVLHTKRIFLKV